MAADTVTPISLAYNGGKAITTASMKDISSSTGVYIDLDGYDGSKVVILFHGVTSTAVRNYKINTGGAKTNWTGQGKANTVLTIADTLGLTLSSAAATKMQLLALGPFETADYLDSLNRILINFDTASKAGAATPAYKVSAILLP